MTIAAKKMTYRAFREMEFPDNDAFLYELLNGVIVRKSASHITHQRVLRKLVRRFEDFVLQSQVGEVFFAPVDVVLSNENAPQPDLIYISQANAAIIDEEEGIVNGVPDLVVEIISPSSIKRDRIEKMAIYEQFKIKEYWLVDPNNQSIEIYILKENKYALHAFADATEKVQSVVLEGLEVEAKDIS